MYPVDPDTDCDGFTDEQEAVNQTDPNDYSIDLNPGWNLFSIARQPDDNSVPGVLQYETVGPCYIWENGQYDAAAAVEPLRGHWGRAPGTSDVTVDVSLP